MIISRTPFRISFVGGGTDLRSYYCNQPGKVLSTAIDKYIYVVIKKQIGIVEHKYRVNWSKVEFCNHIDEIEHPIVREALRLYNVDYPIEITTFTDIPGNTGLGSSSAFAVGLLNALNALNARYVSKHTLATEAAYIEVDLLKRSMGKQDHFASSYGGINVFTFNPDESTNIEPVFYSHETLSSLEANLFLFYTRLKRDASEVLQAQEAATSRKLDVLTRMSLLVDPLRDVLSGVVPMNHFGTILDEAWQMKKSLTSHISSNLIDNYYQRALDAGATGGKLLGAGGGGFLLLYIEPQYQNNVFEALNDLFCLDIKVDTAGTRITYYDQDSVARPVHHPSLLQ